MLKNLLYLLILWSNIVVSQSVLKGRIIDGETKLPLDKANVFVSNTTYIAITDVNGRFIIHVPQNNYQLAVSYVGYGAVVVKSSQLGVNQSNIIELFPETGSIKPVSIISSEKRNNYLRMFRNAVLGTSANAKHARILNINDVFLEISDEGCLVATSDVPLEIENPGLNYKLSFLLKEFKIDMSTETSMYSGYLSFRELVPEKANNKKIQNNRRKTYYGSSMHFIRAAYTDKLKDEGFSVTNFTRKLNPAYPSPDKLKEMYEYARISKDYSNLHKLPQKYIIKKTGTILSSGDFVDVDNDKHVVNFMNYFEIVYNKKYPEPEYFESLHRTVDGFQTSQIQLNKYDVEIFPDGNYFETDGITFFGYMGWKKLADTLPLDYIPE